MTSWSTTKVISWAPRNSLTLTAAALALLLASVTPVLAQNNTGYPSGTKCGELQSQRRTACSNAFNPRPNAAEIINKPAQKPLLPLKPRALGQPVPKTNPKKLQPLIPPAGQ